MKLKKNSTPPVIEFVEGETSTIKWIADPYPYSVRAYQCGKCGEVFVSTHTCGLKEWMKEKLKKQKNAKNKSKR